MDPDIIAPRGYATGFLKNASNGQDAFDMDEEFPAGDGTAETSAHAVCPYCAEVVDLAVDPGGGSFQQYVEDCEVCCNPWQVSVRFIDGIAHVEIAPLDA